MTVNPRHKCSTSLKYVKMIINIYKNIRFEFYFGHTAYFLFEFKILSVLDFK